MAKTASFETDPQHFAQLNSLHPLEEMDRAYRRVLQDAILQAYGFVVPERLVPEHLVEPSVRRRYWLPQFLR